jgi:hypothetical protein
VKKDGDCTLPSTNKIGFVESARELTGNFHGAVQTFQGFEEVLIAMNMTLKRERKKQQQ